MGKPEGMRSLGRHGRRWDSNTKMDLQEVTLEGMEWVDWLKIGTSGGSCECVNEFSGSVEHGEFIC